MSPRPFSRLGLGTGALGDLGLSEETAFALLDDAYQGGVTVVDTARSYGAAEARIGAWLASRGADVAVTTKGGYGLPGIPDWTGVTIARGIEAAIVRLRRSPLDVFFLHSCPLDVARREDILRALEEARARGEIRAAGYSGEGDALGWAVRSGHFAVVQCSLNPFDQANLPVVTEAALRGVTVLAKRPLGNAPWRFRERPVGRDAEITWTRMVAMGFDPAPLAWDELALRFAAYAPGVSCALVGTGSRDHLARAMSVVRDGPLPREVAEACSAAFAAHGAAWPGII